MKSLIISGVLALGMVSTAVYAADQDSAGTIVKDSVITTKVKAKLAAKHMDTLTNIKVDTDSNGAVWLSGTAPTKDAKDLAELVTKDTDGVRSVHNKIVVAP